MVIYKDGAITIALSMLATVVSATEATVQKSLGANTTTLLHYTTTVTIFFIITTTATTYNTTVTTHRKEQ